MSLRRPKPPIKGGSAPEEEEKYRLDVLISQIYLWNKTLHVSDSSSVHRQGFFTVHTAMVYVIQVMLTACEQDVRITCMTRTITVCIVKNT